jgi:hypothetical protein
MDISNHSSPTELLSSAQEDTPSPVWYDDICWNPSDNNKGSSETGAIAAEIRNETIERARSAASAILGQQQEEKQEQENQLTAESTASDMKHLLLERLEAKLLANEMECAELQELADAWSGGIPISITLLHLGWEPEKVSSLGDSSFLLRKVEALVLVRKEECHKIRKLVCLLRSPRESTW